MGSQNDTGFASLLLRKTRGWQWQNAGPHRSKPFKQGEGASSLEVEPNVFVTSLTQDRALEVFEEVQYRGEEIPGFRVILIQEETGLPGYSVRGSGENLLETSSLDGLTFRSRKKKSS